MGIVEEEGDVLLCAEGGAQQGTGQGQFLYEWGLVVTTVSYHEKDICFITILNGFYESQTVLSKLLDMQ